MLVERVVSTFLSTISYAGLIFVILLLFIFLGSTLLTKKFDLKQLLISLPTGSSFFYGISVVVYKLNLGAFVLPLIAATAVLSCYIRFKTSRLTAHELLMRNAFYYRNFLKTFQFAGVASLFAASLLVMQSFVSFPGLPLVTSVDISSGDMFFYMNFSEHVKNVGWDGLINQKNDSTPFNDGLEVPSVFGWDNAGAGLVLISAVSTLFNLEVWQVGQATLLSMWLVVISIASSLIARFSNLSASFSISISILLFCNFAYLTLLGWWALNQIVFSGIFLLIMYLLGSSGERRTLGETTSRWALIASLVALATETYPSIATYGLLPIFAVTFIFTLISSLRGSGWRAFLLLLSLLPLTFLALGTGEFIPRLFRDQFGNRLDIGIRAPNYLQFLGFPPVVDGYYGEFFVGLLDLVLSPAVIGFASIFLILRMFRDNRLYGNLLGFSLIVLGGSSLLIYSALNVTSYHSHKLALQWVPFLFISIIVLFGNSFVLPKFRAVRDGLFFSAAIVVLGNSLVWQIYASSLLTTPENRQLHSISKEIIELKAAINKIDTSSVLMDMSDGQSWTPQDRTVSGGLVSYPGVRIDSSWKLSGYPYYTGWTATDSAEARRENSATSVIEARKVNNQYSLRYICRLICSAPDDRVMALVAGLEVKGNEFNEFLTTFSDALSSPLLTLYLESEPGTTFSYVAVWEVIGKHKEGKVCSSNISERFNQKAEITTGEFGFSRARLTNPGAAGCVYELRHIQLGKG